MGRTVPDDQRSVPRCLALSRTPTGTHDAPTRAYSTYWTTFRLPTLTTACDECSPMGSVLTLIFSDLPTGTINQSWRCGEEAEMGSDVSQSGNPRTAAQAGTGANRPRVELRSYSAYRSTRSGNQRDPSADTAGLAQRFQPPRPRSFIQQCKASPLHSNVMPLFTFDRRPTGYESVQGAVQEAAYRR